MIKAPLILQIKSLKFRLQTKLFTDIVFALVFYLLKTSCSVKSSLEQTHGMILCWILDTGIHATMIPGIGILIGILGIPGMMILDTGIMGMIVMGLITGNNYI